MTQNLNIEKALQDIGLGMDVLVYIGIGAAILGVVARLIYYQLTNGPGGPRKGPKLKVDGTDLVQDEPSESEGTVLREENGQTVRRSTRSVKKPVILDGSELSSPQRKTRTPARTKGKDTVEESEITSAPKKVSTPARPKAGKDSTPVTTSSRRLRPRRTED